MKGAVKSHVSDRGYGFATGEDGKEYFFHRSDCTTGFDHLKVGDRVSFDSVTTAKGPRAALVERLDGEVV
jgi:CspA family cold shock protein